MSVFGRQSMQNRQVSVAVTSDLGPGMHPRISIRGGQFGLLDAGGQRYGAPVILQNTPQGQQVILRVIIIGSNPKKSRIFFDQPYDPDNPGPPDCFSDNGLAPSVNAATPMARTCAECRFSQWGSDTSQVTGKKTKACDEKKKLAVLVVGDTTRMAYELQVPPATLKNMAKYANMLAGQNAPGTNRKADVSDFVTAMFFVPGSTGVLDFTPYAWLTSSYIGQSGAIEVAVDAQLQPLMAPQGGEDVGALIDDIWQTNELDELLGLRDQAWQAPALSSPLPGMTGYIAHQVGHAAVEAAVAPPYPHGGAPQSAPVPGMPAVHTAAQPMSAVPGAPVAPLSPYGHGTPQHQAQQPVRAFVPPALPVGQPQAGAAPAPSHAPVTAPQPAGATPQAGGGRGRRRKSDGPAPPGNVTQFVPPGAAPTAPTAPAIGHMEIIPPQQPQVPPAMPGAAPQQEEIPPFLRRNNGSQPIPAAQGHTPGAPAFGMANPPAPATGVQGAIDAAFNLPTGRRG